MPAMHFIHERPGKFPCSNEILLLALPEPEVKMCLSD